MVNAVWIATVNCERDRKRKRYIGTHLRKYNSPEYIIVMGGIVKSYTEVDEIHSVLNMRIIAVQIHITR